MLETDSFESAEIRLWNLYVKERIKMKK